MSRHLCTSLNNICSMFTKFGSTFTKFSFTNFSCKFTSFFTSKLSRIINKSSSSTSNFTSTRFNSLSCSSTTNPFTYFGIINFLSCSSTKFSKFIIFGSICSCFNKCFTGIFYFTTYKGELFINLAAFAYFADFLLPFSIILSENLLKKSLVFELRNPFVSTLVGADKFLILAFCFVIKSL